MISLKEYQTLRRTLPGLAMSVGSAVASSRPLSIRVDKLGVHLTDAEQDACAGCGGVPTAVEMLAETSVEYLVFCCTP